MRKQKLTGKLITGWLIHRSADRRFCVIMVFDIYICVSINHLCVVWSHKYGSASLCSVCIYKGGMQHFTKSCKSLLSMVDIWATTASTTHNNMIWELPPLVIIVCC